MKVRRKLIGFGFALLFGLCCFVFVTKNSRASLAVWKYVACSLRVAQDPIQTEIQAIPTTNLYYYFNDKQKRLLRSCGTDGVYLHTENSGTKLYVDPEFSVILRNSVDEVQAHDVFRKENLMMVKTLSSGTRYLRTTNSSLYKNGLQEANYLKEHYPNLIESASPNWLMVGRFF